MDDGEMGGRHGGRTNVVMVAGWGRGEGRMGGHWTGMREVLWSRLPRAVGRAGEDDGGLESRRRVGSGDQGRRGRAGQVSMGKTYTET